jgi:hypothetical protein
MFKVFWRLLLPVILAVVLALALTFEFMGQGASFRRGLGGSSFWSYGPLWLRYAGACFIGGIFILFLVSSLWKTLKWGKEAEEYEDMLKEEEADEAKGRCQRDSS